LLLDELNRADRDAQNMLLTLLDEQGYLALDERDDNARVFRASDVRFFATVNIGPEFIGTQPLDEALLSRFGSVIEMDFPPAEKEIAILVKRCPGLNAKNAERLVTPARDQRSKVLEGEFTRTISIRDLLSAGEQIAAGVAFDQAVRYCIVNKFSKDGAQVSERTMVMQIFQKYA
jgi:MoxR-like ATPase